MSVDVEKERDFAISMAQGINLYIDSTLRLLQTLDPFPKLGQLLAMSTGKTGEDLLSKLGLQANMLTGEASTWLSIWDDTLKAVREQKLTVDMISRAASLVRAKAPIEKQTRTPTA